MPRQAQAVPGILRQSQTGSGRPKQAQTVPDSPRQAQAGPGSPGHAQAGPDRPRQESFWQTSTDSGYILYTTNSVAESRFTINDQENPKRIDKGVLATDT
jgi:hypothetical protein